jgi:hypothetical protein
MRIYLAATAALALVGLSFAPIPSSLTQPAQAASPGSAECTADGGTYVPPQDGGPDCIYPTTKPGNDPAGTQGSESQETVSGQGNLKNKTVEECIGNKGQCK